MGNLLRDALSGKLATITIQTDAISEELRNLIWGNYYGKIFYVCDMQACQDCSGNPCCHTSDINHARYKNHLDFDRLPDGSLFERMRGV